MEDVGVMGLQPADQVGQHQRTHGERSREDAERRRAGGELVGDGGSSCDTGATKRLRSAMRTNVRRIGGSPVMYWIASRSVVRCVVVVFDSRGWARISTQMNPR